MPDRPTIPYRCPGCGRPGRAAVGQMNLGHYVHFWHSFQCSACGSMLEGDAGETPEDARQAMLAAYGTFALYVEAEGAARLTAIKTLRARLGLSMAETAALKARLPGPVADGTFVEMDYLRTALSEVGVVARVERTGRP